MIKRSKLYISLCEDFGFWPHFCSEASHGQHFAHGPKNHLKMSGRVLAFPFNSYLKIEAAIFMFVTCKLSVKVLKIR